LLSYICHVLAVISLSTFPYLHHHSSNIFAVNACIVHVVAGFIANSIVRYGTNDFDSSRMNTLGYLGIIMTLCPFLLQYFLPMADEDQLIIYLLAASNILSIMIVSYMRIETRKSFHQLNELKFAQYKHKSL
jgi:predicted membrane protein